MFRTIFGKQLTLYLSVLIVSFVVLGVVLSIFIKNSLMGQRINMLKDIAPQIVTEISSSILWGSPTYSKSSISIKMYSLTRVSESF